MGFVKHEDVYGRIFLRVWPPERWGVGHRALKPLSHSEDACSLWAQLSSLL